MAVRSSTIRRSQAPEQSLVGRIGTACRRYFSDLCHLPAALNWRGRTNVTRTPVQVNQPIIANRLLDETIGTLWVLTTHAELHHLDPRHIDRANRVRQQLERIKQQHQG